jgi:Ca2+/Na+ antiporter
MARLGLLAVLALGGIWIGSSLDCNGTCDVTTCDFLDNLCLNTIDLKGGDFSLPDTPCEGSGWGIFFEILLFLWCMLGLAVVCDEHLCPSLERLCDVWMIREDVAGATFMAFGSAAPEIIINVVGTFKQVGNNPASASSLDATNLGVGAILGSGMIAFLVIPAACALFTDGGVELLLKRRPLLRDVGAYTISLIMLCIFISDGIIVLYEGLTMVLFYVSYVLVVIWAPTIRREFRQRVLHKPNKERVSFVKKDSSGAIIMDGSTKTEKIIPTVALVRVAEEENDTEADGENTIKSPLLAKTGADEEEEVVFPVEGSTTGKSDEEDPKRAATWEKSIGDVLKILVRPLTFLFEWTIPDCAEGKTMENWYAVSFIMSFLWVAFFSTVISSCVVRWTTFTPVWAKGSFFGLLTIAIGAEIPDTIASVTMAKRGYGSMAVSNALGSQIINIAIGLGLPWLLATSLESDGSIQVTDHDDIQIAGYFQFGAVLVNVTLLLGSAWYFGDNKAKLTAQKGKILACTYLAVIVSYIIVMLVEHAGEEPCADA